MKQLLLPVAAAVTCMPVLSQAQVDASLLFPSHWLAPAEITGTQCDLRKFVDAGDYARLTPLHQRMLVRLANRVQQDRDMPHACWLGAGQPAAMALWNAVMQGAGDFNPVQRWTNTATSGGGLSFGDPSVITYSFVPDGTNVPGEVGAPAGPSELFSTFNAAFPSQATWQQRFHDSFAIWGQLTGTTYVYEPNDDGVDLAGSSGQVGVRGDVRIAAKPVDGSSGSNVLAYNYFPNNGDMVLDSDNIAFYADSASNYLRLYNVVTHEHGHGIGIAHVCPVEQTKLMEPFVSVAFVGPQFDDILTAQRMYGDASEPNDTSSTATDLGTLNNGTETTTLVSVDGSNDVDWYRFTVTSAKTADIVLRPTGSPYLEGDQLGNGSCEPGVTFDPTLLRNLAFDVVDTNGVSVLLSVNQAPVGGTEGGSVVLPTAGTYFLRVYGGGVDQIQLYDFDVTISDGPPFAITIVGGVPASVPAEAPFGIDVRVVPAWGTADPNTGLLYTSINGGSYTASSLLHVGGDDFRGLLPGAQCLDAIDWYVTFSPSGGGTLVSSPTSAPAISYTTEALETLFTDNFESNAGWTVVNEAGLTDGAWERGTPVGGGDRGDPATDADGSGQCFLTDNVDGNSDVDGGATRLLSPVFDLSGYAEARMSWSYWYTNDFGGNPNTDFWEVDISNNGGASWTSVLSTTASTTSWTTMEIDVANFVALTNQVQIRFTASDPAPGAVVEAGLDAFRVVVCEAPAVEQLPGACSGAFALSTIGTSATPTAGVPFSIDCSAVSSVSGPVFQGVVIGIGNASLPLPSCGCTLIPTLDILDIQVGNWAAPSLETWSLPLALPVGAAGAVLYAQGFVIETNSATCTEAGLPFNTTDGIRLTIQ